MIAETTSLPHTIPEDRRHKRRWGFVVPDLPKGDYQIWVRGYGLKDSDLIKGTPGGILTLQVTSAVTPQEAAKVYPANYWLSLFKPPSSNELREAAPGRKIVGMGGVILGNVTSTDQNEWVAALNSAAFYVTDGSAELASTHTLRTGRTLGAMQPRWVRRPTGSGAKC